METALNELKNIIYGMDELIDHWFDGHSPNLLSADGDDVYERADYYRNKALEIIERLRKSI